MKLMKSIILILAFLFTGNAFADPGAVVFTNTRSGQLTNVVGVNTGTLVYNFTTATDSVIFSVVAPVATICLDTDISSATAGAGRVELWFAMNPTNPLTVNSLLVISLIVDTNCFDFAQGTYWLEVSTATGGPTAQVTITGKSN